MPCFRRTLTCRRNSSDVVVVVVVGTDDDVAIVSVDSVSPSINHHQNSKALPYITIHHLGGLQDNQGCLDDNFLKVVNMPLLQNNGP